MLDQVIAGIPFSNPIVSASGCFGFGMEYKDLFDPNILGGITLKTLTLQPSLPLPVPRIAEVPSGLLHKIGWENPGLEAFLKMTRLSVEKNLKTPIIVSLGGSNSDEYAQLAKRISDYPFVSAFELDVSSLHTPAEYFSDTQIVEIVKAVKGSTSRPVFVKLRADHIHESLVKSLEQEGISGLSLINSPAGMEVNLRRGSNILGKREYGALSGPLLRPMALKALSDARKFTQMPIIAMGGITCAEDALGFFLLGADLVAVGSGFLNNPLCVPEMIEGITTYFRDQKIDHLRSFIGKAL